MTIRQSITAESFRFAAIVACWSFVFAGHSLANDAEFFENRVRPLLVEKCFSCHSASNRKAKGGLELDSRAAILRGGDRGPAVVPGKPAGSVLIRAVRHVDSDLQMPLEKRLSDAEIGILETWIRGGAEFPANTSRQSEANAAKKHWAFQPIRDPAAAAVRDTQWPRTPIDRFVLASLESRNLTPSPQADKRTLIRRAYFDLIGLPPTWDDVQAFERDASPDAFRKVVDQLLASPRYGERWGRHWLDVARFADTKDGVLMYGDDRMRPFAYTYRDYVIRSFNDDLPFDRFIHEQIAADMIEPKCHPRQLAALGFLTLGRQYDGNVHDIVDDRIDTTTRAFLGLTVSCARCHDHKYDPIPTADYYSLYGVFSACDAPLSLPLLEPGATGPAEFEKKHAAKVAEIESMLDAQYELLSRIARERTADYLVHVATTPPDPMETAIFFFSLDPGALRPTTIAKWREFVARRATPSDRFFGPWYELMALPDDGFAESATALIGSFHGTFHPSVVRALAAATIQTKTDVARAYGGLLTSIWKESVQRSGPPDRFQQKLLDVMTGPDSPAYFPKSQTRKHMSRAETDEFGKKLLDLDKLSVKEPAAPPRAMALLDTPERDDPRIFIRGNPARQGERVERHFLSVLCRDKPQPFPHGSGRLDLAQAITAPGNPLTARVIVNRVWMHHFGEPLVETPSDFGLRSSPPSHPDLLDHLATQFRRDGWSLKALHRSIMLSAAYQQSSADRPECRKVDPGNRLIWRTNRRRLELEPMRDAMLAVGDRLDVKMFGRPVDVAGDPANTRRTVYGLVDRQSLPGMFRSFDFASPDQSAERRVQTTVPQQALFGLNSAFVQLQAKAVAARVASEEDEQLRVRRLYQIALQRDAEPHEIASAVRFVAGQSDASKATPWEQLAQVLLLTNEFQFVD